FWAHERLLATKQFGNKKVKLIISDHRHNPFLTQDQHDHIEKRAAEDPEWGRVYGRGLTGKIEGLIFRNWSHCDEIPKEAELIANSLDFGFTNDPTACITVYRMDGELYIDERLYSTGLTNDKIADALKPALTGVTICDSAEPKSIAELRNFGMYVEPAIKGPDSVKNSIDSLKRYKMHITRSSVNVIKEMNSYKWKVDKVTGNAVNEPVDFMNHAIDALRYVALNKLKPYPSGKYVIV